MQARESLHAVEQRERFTTIGADVAEQSAAIRVTPLAEFAALDEASALALLGEEDDAVLVAGGTLVFYGDGGAGKTTLELDLGFHLAAGRDWLGLPVPKPLRVLVIENEGPRGRFRRKLRAKLAAWGELDDDSVHVLEEPWALFSFAAEGQRDRLRELIEQLAIDVILAGPVQRLGMQGGGTPEEVGAFNAHYRADARGARSSRGRRARAPREQVGRRRWRLGRRARHSRARASAGKRRHASALAQGALGLVAARNDLEAALARRRGLRSGRDARANRRRLGSRSARRCA